MKCVSVYQNEIISSEIVKKICEDLQKDRIEMLSFRNCKFTDKDFKRVMKAVGACTTLALRHLVLNIDIIQDSFRIQTLANAIEKNASLVGLHLHGNNVQDSGLKTLCRQLKRHPRITILDLGDCKIGDDGLEILCNFIKESKDRIGLHSLFLSHNPKITPDGWTRFGLALASGSCLRSLEIDYNDIGDIVATCIAIALPGVPNLETIDMECTGITDKTGEVLLHLIKSSNLKLKEINLDKNKIAESTKDAINYHLFERSVDKKQRQTSIDECSLAMSEPPLSEEVALGDDLGEDDIGVTSKGFTDLSGNVLHTESFDNDVIPSVEVIQANIQDAKIENEKKTQEARSDEEVSQSLTGFETSCTNINAAGFQIKQAFSTKDLSDHKDIDEKEYNQTNSCDEYEAYIPEKESLKDRESSSTLVESMDRENDSENDGLKSKSESSNSVKDCQETDGTSKSVIPAPLFFTQRMSAPMSGNDTVNFETGLVQAKLSDSSNKPRKPRQQKDLASLIRQKKIETSNVENEELEKKNDIEVQDIN